MPTALEHVATTTLTVPGIVLDDLLITPREVQQKTTKFWGVLGESRISGLTAGRTIDVPVLVADEDKLQPFHTKSSFWTWLDTTVNSTQVGETGTLTVTSESNLGSLANCTFDGAILLPGGIKLDEAGSLGGGPFAICRFIFRQHL